MTYVISQIVKSDQGENVKIILAVTDEIQKAHRFIEENAVDEIYWQNKYWAKIKNTENTYRIEKIYTF